MPYYELLKLGEIVNGERLLQQPFKLKGAIAENLPDFATRHEVIIFFYDNAGIMLQARLKII